MSDKQALLLEIDHWLCAPHLPDAKMIDILKRCRDALAAPAPPLSAQPAEPKHQIAQRFNLLPLGMFPSDNGLWVRYNEHLAIVAALEKQLPIRPTPATQEQWLPGSTGR